MHFEILVEDQSGKKALEFLVPKIIGEGHSFRVLSYKGIGRIPRDLADKPDRQKRILLANLPRLLSGYGRTYGQDTSPSAAVILVCDLDKRCLKELLDELRGVLDSCHPKPLARFCIAIEEGEAWLLGDLAAVRAAYPHAKTSILSSYVNDSICDTWEALADALHPGGAKALAKEGVHKIGEVKSKWAEQIAPRVDVASNESPSFQYFRRSLTSLCA